MIAKFKENRSWWDWTKSFAVTAGLTAAGVTALSLTGGLPLVAGTAAWALGSVGIGGATAAALGTGAMYGLAGGALGGAIGGSSRLE